MPTPEQITRHHEPAADVEWVAGGPTPVVDDSRCKEPVVRDVLDRLARAQGLLP